VTETNVFELTQPGTFSDPLTEVLRNGARTLLEQAVEAEVAAWLSTHTDKLTDDGRRRLVRHGHMPEREVMTGIGAVAVRCPRVRDRVGEGGERIRFSSAILPPYARRSKSLEVLIPILYLKGISTGDFEEALIALLGKDAGGLSASTIGRLKEAWSDEHTRWSKRDLSAKRYVYFWVDLASMCKPGSRKPRSACWWSSAPPPKAKRNLSGSSTACARARNRGKSSSSTSNGGGLRWDPSSRSPTVPSASGKRSRRCGRGRAASAVGCTRPPMS